MAARIRKDDIVQIIAGDHKGARGKVLRVIPDKDRVLVEGVNMVYRHMRKSRQNPQGGRVQKEAPIHMSNVMPIDPRTDRPTRVRFAFKSGDGPRPLKQRIAAGRKGSGTVLSDVRHHKPKAEGSKR